MVIPVAATAPVLIVVGLFMMSSVKDINFGDISEGLPAFLTNHYDAICLLYWCWY